MKIGAPDGIRTRGLRRDRATSTPLLHEGIKMVVPEGIEPNCRHPAYYGNGFTVRRREQEPY